MHFSNDLHSSVRLDSRDQTSGPVSFTSTRTTMSPVPAVVNAATTSGSTGKRLVCGHSGHVLNSSVLLLYNTKREFLKMDWFECRQLEKHEYLMNSCEISRRSLFMCFARVNHVSPRPVHCHPLEPPLVRSAAGGVDLPGGHDGAAAARDPRDPVSRAGGLLQVLRRTDLLRHREHRRGGRCADLTCLTLTLLVQYMTPLQHVF